MSELTITALARRVEILEEELRRVQERAERDPLTGLGNLAALERAGRGWFAMFDLDGFKAAQDAHPEGHAHGDAVLREFAEFLVSSCRSSSEGDRRDHVAVRRGGDEFVVWCRSEEGALAVRDRVALWRSEIGEVTCSAGAGATLEAADAAMYRAKRGKR